jgi:hypothetical protein
LRAKLLFHQFQHVKTLLQREWFTRKWIIQEVVKAKEAIAICGFKTMSWNTITKFAGLMGKRGVAANLLFSIALIPSILLVSFSKG